VARHDDYGRDTAEAAALAQWIAEVPEARARVVRVEYFDDETAMVYLDTDPSHLLDVYCVRDANGKWYEHSTSG
jgi:hypothetical protein